MPGDLQRRAQKLLDKFLEEEERDRKYRETGESVIETGCEAIGDLLPGGGVVGRLFARKMNGISRQMRDEYLSDLRDVIAGRSNELPSDPRDVPPEYNCVQ